jgi:hypothetical protein
MFIVSKKKLLHFSIVSYVRLFNSVICLDFRYRHTNHTLGIIHTKLNFKPLSKFRKTVLQVSANQSVYVNIFSETNEPNINFTGLVFFLVCFIRYCALGANTIWLPEPMHFDWLRLEALFF